MSSEDSTTASQGAERVSSMQILREAREEFDCGRTSKTDMFTIRESDEERVEVPRDDSARTTSYVSDFETTNPESEFCQNRKRQLKNLSKILAKEMIAKANKKAIQIIQNQEIVEQMNKNVSQPIPMGQGRQRENLDRLMKDVDLSWVSTSERFKNYTRTRQVLTINRKTEYELQEFRRQETERYNDPYRSYTYKLGNSKFVSGALIRKRA